MRVTHLVAVDQRRGAEIVASSLMEVLTGTAPDLEQRIVAVASPPPGVSPMGVGTVLVPRPGGRTLVPRAVQAARRELARHPADVVLAHGTLAALVATAARPSGTRVVWQRILHLASWPRRHPHHLWLAWLARHVDAVVAITPRTGEEVRQLGFRGPVWLIPNHRPAASFAALDVPRQAEVLRASLELAPGTPLVGFVGHLVAQKQPEHAFEAFRMLRRQRPDAHLVVVGDGPLRSVVDGLASAPDLRGGVTCTGHRLDVPSVLAGLDLLLVPSREDSMPGVAVEAQLAGCPVVAYPLDGIEDAVAPGATGLVTDQATPAALAAACEALLADPVRRHSMGAAARVRAARLTTEFVAPRYLRLLGVVAKTPVAGRQPLTVLQVIPDLGVGGLERASENMARHFDPDDVVMYLVTVGGARRPLGETPYRQLAEHDVAWCALGVAGHPTRSPRALLQARQRLQGLARRLGADVVDAALLDAVLPARLTRGPWVRVSHLVNTPWAPVVRAAAGGRRWRRAALMVADRWSSVRDDAAVALTVAVAEAASPTRGRSAPSPVVIPRGVDLARFVPRELAPASGGTELSPVGPVAVIGLGRLVPQKGHDVVVRALAAARGAGAALTLTILGEGPGEAELRALVARLGLEDQVRLAAPVPDVVPWLQRADLFVLASRWEGQSNAVLEAMACGLPVLVSDLPALREVVGDAGAFAPPGDVDAWAEALVGLAGDRDHRRSLANLACARARSHFDAQVRTAELMALYRSLQG